MIFFRKKITLVIFLFFSLFFVFGKKFNIKKSRIEKEAISIVQKKKKNIISLREDKDYKYVIFDISNCFWQKSLYDILMSFRKNLSIPFKGYLELLQCGVSYAFGTLDAKKGYEAFFKYYKSMSEKDVKAKCKLVWENDCKNYIYNDAVQRFEQHQKDGLITIMVDAGIAPLYDEFLKIYKFDYVFTSHLEFKDGMTTGKLKGNPCSNKHKYEVIKKLIEDDLKGSLKDVIFYANSHNDIPLLDHVGKPVVVNPNTKLRKRAYKKGWKILNFSAIKKNSI